MKGKTIGIDFSRFSRFSRCNKIKEKTNDVQIIFEIQIFLKIALLKIPIPFRICFKSGFFEIIATFFKLKLGIRKCEKRVESDETQIRN